MNVPFLAAETGSLVSVVNVYFAEVFDHLAQVTQRQQRICFPCPYTSGLV
jgi:hypothetical protein